MNVPPWNPAPGKIRDRLSEIGATATALDIVERWRALGYENVTATIEPIAREHYTRAGEIKMYAVRTNLVGGLPPRTATARAGV